MEKQRPHYDLKAILAQMSSVEAMNLTQSALNGIREAGMTRVEALAAVQTIKRTNFYKSMTTHKNHQVWQDVYHVEWREKAFYVKNSSKLEIFLLFRSRSVEMASRWNDQQCPLCFEGTLQDGSRNRSLEYRRRIYEYTSHGAFCDHCGDGFPKHDKKEEANWKAFRDKVDAEEALELARIRKKLKLTQREAARIAGGGHNAFSRYERGEAKPVQAVLNLFRLLDQHPELLKEIR